MVIESEFKVVTDKAEWRHWTALNKCSKPTSYDYMTDNGDIDLPPQEEIEILLKFLTIREVPAIVGDKTNYPPQAYVRPRKVIVTVMQYGRAPYTSMEVNVVPSSAPVDHTFRYYEPQNSHVNIQVPPFLQLDQVGIHAVLSKPNAVVDIDRKTGVMTVQTKTDEENTIQDITLFVYNDIYREKLLATCSLEIHSMVSIYTKIKAGLQVQ